MLPYLKKLKDFPKVELDQKFVWVHINCAFWSSSLSLKQLGHLNPLQIVEKFFKQPCSWVDLVSQPDSMDYPCTFCKSENRFAPKVKCCYDDCFCYFHTDCGRDA